MQFTIEELYRVRARGFEVTDAEKIVAKALDLVRLGPPCKTTMTLCGVSHALSIMRCNWI